MRSVSLQTCKIRGSTSQEPHYPAGREYPAHEHGKAIQTVLDLIMRGVALSDAKNGGRENCKQQGSAEMCELQGSVSYGFFPIAM